MLEHHFEGVVLKHYLLVMAFYLMGGSSFDQFCHACEEFQEFSHNWNVELFGKLLEVNEVKEAFLRSPRIVSFACQLRS
jgi:hypothetical protein